MPNPLFYAQSPWFYAQSPSALCPIPYSMPNPLRPYAQSPSPYAQSPSALCPIPFGPIPHAPIPNYPIPIPNSQLLTCSLLTVNCSLLTVNCSLFHFAACCVSLVSTSLERSTKDFIPSASKPFWDIRAKS